MSHCINSDTQAKNLLSRAGRMARLLLNGLALSARLKHIAGDMLGVCCRLSSPASIAGAALSSAHPNPQCIARHAQISFMLMICSTVLGAEFFNHINPT